MIRMQLVTAVAVGLVATGCSYSSTTQAVVPAGPLTASDCSATPLRGLKGGRRAQPAQPR